MPISAVWHLAISLVVATLIGTSSSNELFGPLWILPLTYGVTSLLVLRARLLRPAFRYFHVMFLLLLLLRFVATPALMQIASSEFFYSSFAPVEPTEYGDAVLFMAFEGLASGLLVLGLTLLLAPRKISSEQQAPREELRARHSATLLGLFVLISSVLFVLPQVRERYSFFTAEITTTARNLIASYTSGYDSLASLSNLARMLAPAVVISWAVRGYRKASSPHYPLLAMFLIVTLNLFYVATSRASFFIPLAASGIALWVLMPRSRRLALFVLGGGIAVATLTVTIQKSAQGGISGTAGWAANYLSTYLMGPQEYAVGLRSLGVYGDYAGPTTLLNDLIGNVPGISVYADLINRTSQFYNWTYLNRVSVVGGGFIIPSSVQAAFYLGVALAPLGLIVGLLLAAVGQRTINNPSRSPAAIYLGSFAMVSGILFHANSVSTLVALISFPLVPGMLLAGLDSCASRWVRNAPNGVAS